MNRNINSNNTRQRLFSETSRTDVYNHSINDLIYMYRNLTNGMRDVMTGYNHAINYYNQNVSRYLSTINDYRNDIRILQTELLNESARLYNNNLSSTPIQTQQTRPTHTQSRTENMSRVQLPNTTRNNLNTQVGNTESFTFSSPNQLFSNIFAFPSLNRNVPINLSIPNFNDVIVSPSQSEIDNSVETFNYTENDRLINTNCPITMEEFAINDRVSRIRHCGHTFTEEALNNWFRLNVRCPVCRYDIREYTNNTIDSSINTIDTSANNTVNASNNIDISNSNINNDITEQITIELTNLLTQAWRNQMQSNRISPNSLISFDIPISVTRTYIDTVDDDNDNDDDDNQ